MKTFLEIIENEIERYEDLLDEQEFSLVEFNKSIARKEIRTSDIRKKNEILREIDNYERAIKALEDVIYLYDEEKEKRS